MICQNCGQLIEDDFRFCEFCGSPVKERISVTSQQDTELTGPAAEKTENIPTFNDMETMPHMESEGDRTVILPEGSTGDISGTAVPETEARKPAPAASSSGWQNSEQENSSRVCGNCGEMIPSGVKFCGMCGAPVEGIIKDTHPSAIFCQNCGKKLSIEVRFCDRCGTPVGEATAPIQPTAAMKPKKPSMFAELIKNVFKAPIATAEIAAEKEAATAGIAFLLIKSGILALLTAVCMSEIVSALGYFSSVIPGEAIFKVVLMVFFFGLLFDAMWIAATYGGGRISGGNCSIQSLLGTAGTLSIFQTSMIIIIAIFTAISAELAMCFIPVSSGVTVMTIWIILSRTMKVSKERLLYAVSGTILVFAIVVYLILKLLLHAQMEELSSFDFL